ncbi:f003b6f6-37fc-493c-8165-7aca750438c6 [Sclerotinia trifoliorum]|uniref:F003b6f6-37fc-493c-8165-7aca750438c6 n=1 Tax=Sclerotinia trifoliorum TaxID=28548 RepID=A0A8H2W5D8_9HELO|nr:f003b6f6-37fc-493c-8165-7aca750438c6 [Sclerotinia trifoliorum]
MLRTRIRNSLCTKIYCARQVFSLKLLVSRKGTEKGIIRLPEEQPEVIRTFVHWIYVDEYLCLSFKNFDTRGPAGQPAGILVKPYVLGDKYLMPRLCNKVMDALTAYCFTGGGKCPLEILDHACKNTAKDSQLRKYLASTTVEYLHEALHNMDEKLYPELIHDIAMHLMRARRDHKDYEPPLTFCEKYHIHGPEPRTPCKEGERNRGGWILYRY